jgi:acyl-CoA hydrolase
LRKTRNYSSVPHTADFILDTLGPDLTVGIPLGLGKPVPLVNELYQRAKEDQSIHLEILTALSLDPPQPSSDLERRLIEPLTDRIFGGYTRLDYVRDRKKQNLPENVDVVEFYVQPGSILGNPTAQQSYLSTNFTFAVRELLDRGINVVATLISPPLEIGSATYYSTSCNADLGPEVIDELHRRHSAEEDFVVVGQVNENLPYLQGDAELKAERFDVILESDELNDELFGVPHEPIDSMNYAIGLHASSLIRDDGTLQLGIGSMSDAVTAMLLLRQRDPQIYEDMLDEVLVSPDQREMIEQVGGTEPLETGLYAGTEMLVPGFIHLLDEGLLERKVYDDEHVQALANQFGFEEGITLEMLSVLYERGAIDCPPDEDNVRWMHRWGILRPGVELDEKSLKVENKTFPANWRKVEKPERFRELILGEGPSGGTRIDAGFYLGPNEMYERLRSLPDDVLDTIRMRRISFVNDLFGTQRLKMLQRRRARFINSAMKVTVTGAVVSDGLEDQQVISGVGGQYNFISMAHALPDGRSIIMVPSTRRTSDGSVESNIVWNYGHMTIPRHLRDIVVTEYGAVDLHAKTDAECIREMIKVCDSRFQEELVQKAKDHGKLPEGYDVPEPYRNNYPDVLENKLERFQNELPTFPFGTVLNDVERDLVVSLEDFKSTFSNWSLTKEKWRALRNLKPIPERHQPYLERMDLSDPSGLRERLYRRIVSLALRMNGY